MQPQQLWHGRMQQRDNILAFGTKKCETVQPVEQCVFHNQETLCQCNRVLVSHVTMSLLEGHSRFAAALQKHLGILQSSELSSHPYGCGDHSALVWSNATGTNGCQTLPLRGLLENIASNRLFWVDISLSGAVESRPPAPSSKTYPLLKPRCLIRKSVLSIISTTN